MKPQAGGKAHYQFNWLSEHLRTPEEQRIFAQEIAVLVAAQTVIDAMESAQLSRAELAKRIGKSKGFVSQVLSGSRNMTMRTLGDFLWACDKQVSTFSAVPIGQCTVSHELMDGWLDEDSAIREDALVSSAKNIDLKLNPEAASLGVAA